MDVNRKIARSLLTLKPDYGLASITYERELALVVEDIAALIKIANAEPAKPPMTKTRYGNIAEVLLPRGVSMIASRSDNPLRFAIAPLAASIAARNTIVLIVLEPSKFVNVLRSCARKYLDSLAIHIEQVNDLKIEIDTVDHILVIGESWISRSPADMIGLTWVMQLTNHPSKQMTMKQDGPLYSPHPKLSGFPH